MYIFCEKDATIICHRHSEDSAELTQRTKLSAIDLMELSSLYLKSAVFTFRDNLYAQAEGLPMGSPLSPVVANIFMENFENIAIKMFRRPPKIWKRYVDDTFVIVNTQHAVSLCTSPTLTKRFNSQWTAKMKKVNCPS